MDKLMIQVNEVNTIIEGRELVLEIATMIASTSYGPSPEEMKNSLNIINLL